jgi:class 3 adenylate cyclase/ActR/RegA family two-component response regulator
MNARVLIVQHDAKAAQDLTRYFRHKGRQVWEAWELGQAQALLEQVKPELLLVDLHLPEEGWAAFIQRAQAINPALKVIITSQFPDVQREMLAHSNGWTVFLRQPFEPRWIENALLRAENNSEFEPAAPENVPPHARTPRVRFPIWLKIILPYLLLAALLTLGTVAMLNRVVYETSQERFTNQLIAARRQASEAVVAREDRLLESLRLTANTQGVTAAVAAGDVQSLRSLTVPLALNANLEVLALLNPQGDTVFMVWRGPDSTAADYRYITGGNHFSGQSPIRQALAGNTDVQGDKYSGWLLLEDTPTLYVCGPLYSADGQPSGAAVIGLSLTSLARQIKSDILAEISLYDKNGLLINTTLSESIPSLSTQQAAAALSGQDSSAQMRTLPAAAANYSELIGPFELRDGQDWGLLGAALPQTFILSASRITRVQIFILAALGIGLVFVTGLAVSSVITRPIERLTQAADQVAHGKLGVKVSSRGDDELGLLSSSFNQMVAGLQEGSIYRDLLGRTVSPEVRDQLRQTFLSGSLRLEGQEAVATVLMSDIRGFTTLSEEAEPAQVMAWLNEYYDRLVPIVVRHGGVVNKFDGDALLAFFGILPGQLTPHLSALAACRAALEMQQAIEALNTLRASRGEPLLVTGIGINTGSVIAGGLGARDRLHYTIIGDTVNAAQRIEGLTRQLLNGSGVLISHATYTELEEDRSAFHIEALGVQTIKGRVERMMIYHLEERGSRPDLNMTF